MDDFPAFIGVDDQERARRILQRLMDIESDVTSTKRVLREVQGIVGPRGSLDRVQAGGVEIDPGGGVRVYDGGILKSTIEADGDVLAGQDITDPAQTSFAVFVNAQVYNNEDMEEGDILIGDNTSGKSNAKWDASVGQWQFRIGTTVTSYMDTDGTFVLGSGEIAGWEITSTMIQKLASGVGVILDSSIPAVKVGDTGGTYLILDGANNRMRSSNFATGSSGFNIDGASGDAEFNNLKARGMIRTAVFQKDTVSAVGGQLLIVDSDALAADMTQADAETLTIQGNTTFSVGDILRMKDGANDEWLEVAAIGGGASYSVNRDKAGSYTANQNPAWKKGQAVVNYGGSGSGGLRIIGGADPAIQAFTHLGSPWTTEDTVFSLSETGLLLAQSSGVITLGSDCTVSNDGSSFIIKQNGAGHDIQLQLNNGTNTRSATLQRGGVGETNLMRFDVDPGASDAAEISMGTEVVIWAGIAGKTTVFNESGKDIDFRIEGDTNANLFALDAGLDSIGVGGAATANQFTVYNGAVFNEGGGDYDFRVEGENVTNVLTVDASTDRVAIGLDHFIPTASSGNPNVYFNEQNQDMDFHVEGGSDANLFHADAGLDAVGIGTAAVSGFKLAVGGSAQVSGGFLNLGAAVTKTISGGVITATQTRTLVDTQGGAATDDLDTINGGTNGDLIILSAADSAHTVVCKDGTGNLLLAGDFSLDHGADKIVLMYSGANWVEQSRSDNA